MRKIQEQIMELYKKTIALLLKQIQLLQKQIDFKQARNKNGIVYETAKSCLGKNMRTRTSAEKGCADALNNVWLKTTGKEIGGTTSTLRMYNALRKGKRFAEVSMCMRGDIVISPTGFGNGRIAHGHVGILLGDDKIASNDSNTGLFSDHWILEKWIEYYSGKGNFLVKFYRIL